MTTRDIETLRELLIQLNARDLVGYQAAFLPQLPSGDIERPDMIVNDICDFMLAIVSTEDRMRLMSLAYCWLMPRGILHMWRMYVLNWNTDLHFHYPTVFERISIALRVPDYNVQMTWYAKDGTFYACLLTEDEETRPHEHNVLTIAVWSGLPLLAVRGEGASIRHRFNVALRAAGVCESFTLLEGLHIDLNAAFAAGRTFVNSLSDHLSESQHYHGALRRALSDPGSLPDYEI